VGVVDASVEKGHAGLMARSGVAEIARSQSGAPGPPSSAGVAPDLTGAARSSDQPKLGSAVGDGPPFAAFAELS